MFIEFSFIQNLPDGSSLTLPFETHSRNYKNGIAIMTPILPMIFDAWERQKQNKNLLFLTYEEMIQDIDRFDMTFLTLEKSF